MKAEIHSDPNIMHGNPVFKGTRIPVYQIIEAMKDGDSEQDVLEGYPSLTKAHLALIKETPKKQE